MAGGQSLGPFLRFSVPGFCCFYSHPVVPLPWPHFGLTSGKLAYCPKLKCNGGRQEREGRMQLRAPVGQAAFRKKGCGAWQGRGPGAAQH